MKCVEEAVVDYEQSGVVYCASQQCDSSTIAAQKLGDAGFSNVHDLETERKTGSKPESICQPASVERF